MHNAEVGDIQSLKFCVENALYDFRCLGGLSFFIAFCEFVETIIIHFLCGFSCLMFDDVIRKSWGICIVGSRFGISSVEGEGGMRESLLQQVSLQVGLVDKTSVL